MDKMYRKPQGIFNMVTKKYRYLPVFIVLGTCVVALAWCVSAAGYGKEEGKEVKKKNVDWADLHGGVIKKKRLEWRSLKRPEKEIKHGMRDLWDPAKRTELCVSCHIGNEKEGKVLTHEMYVAGHPPLPSFDMATFS